MQPEGSVRSLGTRLEHLRTMHALPPMHRARLMGREVTPLMVVGPWPLFNVLVSYQKVVSRPLSANNCRAAGTMFVLVELCCAGAAECCFACWVLLGVSKRPGAWRRAPCMANRHHHSSSLPPAAQVPLPFFFLPNAHLVNGRGNPPLAVLQAYHQV